MKRPRSACRHARRRRARHHSGPAGTSPVGRTLALAAFLALANAGCASEGEPPPSADVAVEFTYGRSGGLCPGPDGGGAVCSVTVVVGDDGSWTAAGFPVPTPGQGSLPVGSASRLATVFDEGWGALTAREFTDTCPTAYDGSEIVYTVRLLPRGASAPLADAIVREVRSCTHDLNHPSARAVIAELEDLWRELGLPS